MNEKEYYNLIKPYEDAMQMILSRLDTLNHTLYESLATHLVPIHNIQSRIKSKKSIEDKLIKKEKKPSLTNAKNFLMDIAGARVICYFVNDIYNLVEILKSQTDLIVMKERDYIEMCIRDSRYAALIQVKSTTNCNAHLAESIFQTRYSFIKRKEQLEMIGENIKTYRQKKGYTQEEVCLLYTSRCV